MRERLLKEGLPLVAFDELKRWVNDCVTSSHKALLAQEIAAVYCWIARNGRLPSHRNGGDEARVYATLTKLRRLRKGSKCELSEQQCGVVDAWGRGASTFAEVEQWIDQHGRLPFQFSYVTKQNNSCVGGWLSGSALWMLVGLR